MELTFSLGGDKPCTNKCSLLLERALALTLSGTGSPCRAQLHAEGWDGMAFKKADSGCCMESGQQYGDQLENYWYSPMRDGGGLD